MNFNISTHLNDDGTFTDQLMTDLPQILGDEFKDADLKKMFDRTGDCSTLFKNFAHTKRAFNTKMDGVIQKPSETATDAEKTAFRQTLLKELGAPGSAADYGFKPPSLPEGMKHNEQLDQFYADLFAKLGIPVDIATSLRNSFIEQGIQHHNDMIEAEGKAFDTDVENFTKTYPGDKATETARAAHDLLMDIGSDDVKMDDGTVVKGLKTILKEARLYDTPTDYKKWRDSGIDMNQLDLLAKLAHRTSGGRMLGKEGEEGGKGDADSAFVKAVNAGSPGFQVESEVAGGVF